MRIVTTLFFIAALIVSGGCSRQLSKEANDSAVSVTNNMPSRAEVIPAAKDIGLSAGANYYGASQQAEQKAEPESLQSVNSAQAASQAIERKIIRNGELTIELDSPEEAQRRITAIAEKHGGFVVTSETRQNAGAAQASPKTSMTVVVRVPSAKFGEAVEEIQNLGGQVRHRKIVGQDVTEEFIDLEARIRTKRALESQFLEIMKRAAKVSDALEVQKELSEVRTEIERLEGRRRFLENQSALSTITITLQTPAPFVAATTGGFWHSIKMAFGDGLDMATGIVLGIIQLVLVLIPILILIILPGWILFRWILRRVDWFKRPTPIRVIDQNE